MLYSHFLKVCNLYIDVSINYFDDSQNSGNILAKCQGLIIIIFITKNFQVPAIRKKHKIKIILKSVQTISIKFNSVVTSNFLSGYIGY